MESLPCAIQHPMQRASRGGRLSSRDERQSWRKNQRGVPSYQAILKPEQSRVYKVSYDKVASRIHDFATLET